MKFPQNIQFDDKLCRAQINNLRKTRPMVQSECKFHIGHIYREIRYQLEQINFQITPIPSSDDETGKDVYTSNDFDEFMNEIFLEVNTIMNTPGLINTLMHECIKHNCSPQFLRDVIDQYDSNGEISGMRLLVSMNRLRRGIWEYNILERVECIEENYLRWSFRKCVFEMEAIHEVKPALFNRTTMVTKLLYKANHHTKLDEFASNSMLIFDMLHDEFLESTSPNEVMGFSFQLVNSATLLDCIKSLGIDIDSENFPYDEMKKRKLN